MTSVLMNRGFHALEAVTSFLSTDLEALVDPFKLPGMAAAISRIQEAILGHQKICIYGDYDVDGMTSVAILFRAFKALGLGVETYIPDRIDEGYGINTGAITHLADQGVALVITVDCGITAVAPARVAKSLGVDLIITDHHECQPDLPEAVALINPKLPGANYPFEMLAGAGIALKLAMALLGEDFYAVSRELLALSAIGTIADLAPLIDENRIIAKYGLEALTEIAHSGDSVGLSALIEVCGLREKEITAGHVGFMMGPRLNAVGRLEHARDGVCLLITEDAQRAQEIAASLDALNKARQEAEKSILEEALQRIESDAIHTSTGMIIVWGPHWHTGVVGIVASRLVERYYRPVIVLSEQEGLYKGSARSVEGYSIFEALMAQSKWLQKFGGHEQAAGLTLKQEDLQGFIEDLKVYNRTHLTEDHLVQKVHLDATLTSQVVRLQLLEELSHLEPYGLGNPKPVFRLSHLRLDDARRMGKQQEHVKLTLNDHYKLFEAVAFKYGNRPLPFKGKRIDLAVQLDFNTWQGVESVQLLLKDYRSYDPRANDFTRLVLGHYLIALLRFLLDGPFKFDMSMCRKPEGRSDADLSLWLEVDVPLHVWSYEGLLEVAYYLHDRGHELEAMLNQTLLVLPSKLTSLALGHRSLDVPLSSQVGEGYREVGMRRLDHIYGVEFGKGLAFDRTRGAELFAILKREGHLDLVDHFQTTDTPEIDLVAVGFFIESSFAVLEGNELKFLQGTHKKVKYEESNFATQVVAFKQAIEDLSVYMRGFREL